MKIKKIALVLALIVSCSQAAPIKTGPPADESFRHEVQRAIERGVDYLRATQNAEGWWSTADHPSVTALALSAILGEPGQRFKDSPRVRQGYAFLLSCAKPDGGIYVTNLANYNTSISMMALLVARDPKFDDVLRKARSYVIGSQVESGDAEEERAFNGGIGYSNQKGRSDMNNTLVALEALYYSKHLAKDQNLPEKHDLNWAAAIQFIKNCQNLPDSNKQVWVSTEPSDRGGFVYDPGASKAGSFTNAAGKVALRSYGSISYAGLLSFVYADLQRDDPRVKAALEWLQSNVSLEENPGMGPQGYYYYLHLMAKALTAAQVDVLRTKDGREIDWRREVAMKLINLQKSDGSWQNENGRWWEKDSALVTAYSAIALEIIYRGL